MEKTIEEFVKRNKSHLLDGLQTFLSEVGDVEAKEKEPMPMEIRLACCHAKFAIGAIKIGNYYVAAMLLDLFMESVVEAQGLIHKEILINNINLN